jgi:hypothetical protein
MNGAMGRHFIERLKGALESHTELLEWIFKWVAYVATAASVLWAALSFVTAKNELHLVVWVEEDSVLFPSEATWDEPLPLAYGNASAKSVRLLVVNVSNFGRTTIGKQESLWHLAIEAPTSSHIAAIGELRITPNGIVARSLPGPKPNALALELGALEAGASIVMHLMLLNTQDGGGPRIVALPSLVGLPHEQVNRSPDEQILEQLALPVIVSVLLILIVVFGPREYALARRRYGSGWPLVRNVAAQSVGVIVLAAFLGFFLAKGLANLMTWLG